MSDKPATIVCLQCAMKAMIEKRPYYGEPDRTLFEHVHRVHPDPFETAAERARLIEEAEKCICRTAGCGHLAAQHGPGGVCEVCGKPCWS